MRQAVYIPTRTRTWHMYSCGVSEPPAQSTGLESSSGSAVRPSVMCKYRDEISRIAHRRRDCIKARTSSRPDSIAGATAYRATEYIQCMNLLYVEVMYHTNTRYDYDSISYILCANLEPRNQRYAGPAPCGCASREGEYAPPPLVSSVCGMCV